jgi:hypothetical protein
MGDQERGAEDGERHDATKSLCARSLLHFKLSRSALRAPASAKSARCRANVTL